MSQKDRASAACWPQLYSFIPAGRELEDSACDLPPFNLSAQKVAQSWALGPCPAHLMRGSFRF